MRFSLWFIENESVEMNHKYKVKFYEIKFPKKKNESKIIKIYKQQGFY